MSSENLNINVDPLKEKSDKIEFTVDKMGLSNPAQTVPTDVDYFIRKQKGELESKFTWSEALSKSFEIDNLFCQCLINLFTFSAAEDTFCGILLLSIPPSLLKSSPNHCFPPKGFCGHSSGPLGLRK